MDYITTFIFAVLLVACWMIFIYPIFPKLYFMTVNHQPMKRLAIFGQVALIALVLLILFALLVPAPDNDSENVALTPFFIGLFASIGFIVLGAYKKINRTQEVKTVEFKADTPKKTFYEKLDEMQAKQDAKAAQSKLEFEQSKAELKQTMSDIKSEFKSGWAKFKSEIRSTPDTKQDAPVEIPVVQSSYAKFVDDIKNKPPEPERTVASSSYKTHEDNFRYLLEYVDRFGTPSRRSIDITWLDTDDEKRHWAFEADTADGERTFKISRVVCLRDKWTNEEYDTPKKIRDHLLIYFGDADDDEDDD